MSQTAAPTELPAAVLFDQDGTLVDTEPVWMDSEVEMVTRAGGTWTHEMAADAVGRPIEFTGRALSERGGVPGTVEQIVDELVGMVVDHLRTQGVPWMAGALDTLAMCRDLGVPCALVTSSYRRLAQVVVDASDGELRFAVTGDEVANAKPDPEPYLTAAAKLGVDIRDCIAVEDSPSGLGSALASGAHVIGIPCVKPIEARPGLSRLGSLAELNEDVLRRVASGEVVDTLVD